jgi:hypothetical protein
MPGALLIWLERLLLGDYEFGEAGGLLGLSLPSMAMRKTAPTTSFRIVYLRRRNGDREGDES